MTKHLKKVLALLLAIVLCLGTVPFPAFAVGVTPDLDFPAEVIIGPEETDIVSSPEPESGSSPRGSPAPDVSATPDNTSLSSESDDDLDEITPGTELYIYQVWTAVQKAQVQSDAAYGTSGTLYVGDYCFPGGVGTPPTLGERIGPMPIETMRYGSNNVAAYCLEHEKESGDGMGYTWTDLSTNNQETLGTILALGFQWNSSSVWAVPSDNSDKWVVTQLLIWETIAGHAFVQGNGLIGVESGVDADMQMVAEHAYNPTKFMDYYRDLKQKLNDYYKVPSFANKEAKKAETITLRWDGSKYSATVTDYNTVLANYNFSNAVSGVQISSSGNTLTLSTIDPILDPVTSSAIKTRSGAAGGDPVSCYIKVKEALIKSGAQIAQPDFSSEVHKSWLRQLY